MDRPHAKHTVPAPCCFFVFCFFFFSQVKNAAQVKCMACKATVGLPQRFMNSPSGTILHRVLYLRTNDRPPSASRYFGQQTGQPASAQNMGLCCHCRPCRLCRPCWWGPKCHMPLCASS